jgi:hypothetical protein
MSAPTYARHQRGAGLVDVLVAMVLLSAAVASLAQLQAVAFGEYAETRLRSMATTLARAKLDDLRAYSQLDAGAPGVFGYDEITTDGGGTEDGEGRLRLPAGTVEIDGTRFERRWSAAPRYFCAPDAPPTDLPCASRPALLALTVVVAWSDREARPRQVVLEGSAVAIEPLAGAVPVPD